MDPTVLTAEEINRWRFNGLMDFKKPKRQPADCLAFYKSLLTEAYRILKDRRAEAEALPFPTVWYDYQEKEVRAAHAKKKAAEARVYAQEVHCRNLRQQYSLDLAHSIWYNREDARRALVRRIQDEWHAARRAHDTAQDVWEQEQVDKAMAELVAANPHLSEVIKAKIARRLKYRIYIAGWGRGRSAAPHRVMRGVPLVLVGRHAYPTPVIPEYPPMAKMDIDRAI